MCSNITERLFSFGDEKYKVFTSNLIPSIPKEKFIGVRIPVIRRLSKEIIKEGLSLEFIQTLPHKYIEEYFLHSFIISADKSYESVIANLNVLLPFVDNWAVCDSIKPLVFKKNRDDLFLQIEKWITAEHLYTKRFAIGMLMTHFLSEDYIVQANTMAASIETDEYYLNMMLAWYFATALAKNWDTTLPFITKKKLSSWVHNKTIQKAVESYRITQEQKVFLKTLKI